MNDLITKIKGLLLTKTFWTGVALTVVTNFTPDVQRWIAAHPGAAGSIVAAVFGVVLRWVTTQSVAQKGGAKAKAERTLKALDTSGS